MNNSTTLNTMENTSKKYEAIIFDLDGPCMTLALWTHYSVNSDK